MFPVYIVLRRTGRVDRDRKGMRLEIRQLGLLQKLSLRKIIEGFYQKKNPMTLLSDVENTHESLPVFSGNNSVHGFYDFLLDYRGAHVAFNGKD
ncbi:hypothetical protein Tco_0442691 [Tanacetum coccineum]